MKGNPEERAIQLGQYLVEHQTTVRRVGEVFGISKSTVHKDLTQRLRKENHALYIQVHAVLERNKQERHLRGGKATQDKYRLQNSKHSDILVFVAKNTNATNTSITENNIEYKGMANG